MNTRRKTLQSLLTLAFAATLELPVNAGLLGGEKSADDIAKEKSEIRKMTSETLANLYKLQPSAKQSIAKAAGYAVFSNFGMKILFAGTGSGKGIVFDKRKKREVFMKMIEVQAGLGLGVKKFSVVFVFDNAALVNEFIESGWEAGAQATAAGSYDGQGASMAGAIAVKPGVWMYQMTGDGLAVELTVAEAGNVLERRCGLLAELARVALQRRQDQP